MGWQAAESISGYMSSPFPPEVPSRRLRWARREPGAARHVVSLSSACTHLSLLPRCLAECVGVRPKFLMTDTPDKTTTRKKEVIPLIFFKGALVKKEIAGEIKLLLIAQLPDYLCSHPKAHGLFPFPATLRSLRDISGERTHQSL